MSALFSGTTCFFVGILAFAVFGFQRGWRRELISLVSILLASIVITASTSNAVGTFLGRIPAGLAYLVGLSQTPSSQPLSFIQGPIWSLVIFGGLIVLGYFVGNKVFPKPVTPPERIIGIIPGVVSGAIVLGYLENFIQQQQSNNSTVTFDIASANPANYIPVIFVVAILALVVAIIVSRTKKPAAKK